MAKRGRREPEQERTSALGAAVGAVELVQTTRERLNALLKPVATLVGGVGILMLLGCGALHLLPPERWPSEVRLAPARLPQATMIALVAASLLGWSCMQEGLASLRRAVGWRVGGWLFVLLPLACALLTFLAATGRLSFESWPGRPWSELALRWYAPAVITTALLTYWVGSARGPGERRAGLSRFAVEGLLVLPYALLLAVLVFGAPFELVSAGLRETLGELGQWAIVLQVVLAYFCCASSE